MSKPKKRDRRKASEILGLCFFLIGLFVLASLRFHHPSDHPYFSSRPNQPPENPTGLIGAYLAHYFLFLFGTSAYFIAVIFVFWSVCLFLQKVPERKLMKGVGFLFFLLASSGLFALGAQGKAKFEQGGLLGFYIGHYLENYFGPLGTLILLVAFLLLSLLLATEFFLFPIVQSFVEGTVSGVRKLWDAASFAARAVTKSFMAVVSAATRLAPSRKNLPQKKTLNTNGRRPEAPPFMEREMPVRVKAYADAVPTAGPKPVARPVPPPRKPAPPPFAPPPQMTAKADGYVLPSVELLTRPEKAKPETKRDLAEKSSILEATLRDFEIEARVVEIEQGPAVTLYQLIPAPGVKVSSIVSRTDDLALALKAPSLRIMAPIPGKAAVGIEVPNSVADAVFLGDLLLSPEFRSPKIRLPLTIGKDTSGQAIIADLAEMPHLLIAGTTGSGKTVCINAVIAGLLYRLRPDELKLVMIDPKMVELAVYKEIPHMLSPVVTDPRKAAVVLNWVVNEMENRYKLFASCTVRNIQAFNERPGASDDAEIPTRLPYIVVVIDELADLMLVAQDKVEIAIARLAQLSRAVGIHLVLATQRPSVDVITGVIKANFPARICFKVASKVDSRTVLDLNGGEALLGKGDLLFLEPGEAKPLRGQGAFVTDREIAEIVKCAASQQSPRYLADLEKGDAQGDRDTVEKDELYREAVKVVLAAGQASTSILQRRLRLGYGRAARMLDMMEQEGLVGPPQGTKPREILVDRMSHEV
jgi:S-DNA-T family DNA segregation ATPase FtsK/SpoIIIE